jgi:hypothetical protein
MGDASLRRASHRPRLIVWRCWVSAQSHRNDRARNRQRRAARKDAESRARCRCRSSTCACSRIRTCKTYCRRCKFSREIVAKVLQRFYRGMAPYAALVARLVRAAPVLFVEGIAAVAMRETGGAHTREIDRARCSEIRRLRICSRCPTRSGSIAVRARSFRSSCARG